VNGGQSQVIGSISIGCGGNNTAMIMCALRRNGYGNEWIATHIAEPAQGRNW